ncbi:hypothetical protein KY339_05875 [Candidatus Woesearchaeota archaeon]|nr:hypothetical protein [Candidatus Woesearchaeota archaeon]
MEENKLSSLVLLGMVAIVAIVAIVVMSGGKITGAVPGGQTSCDQIYNQYVSHGCLDNPDGPECPGLANAYANTPQCQGTLGYCGNGIVDVGEECDVTGCSLGYTCNSECVCESTGPQYFCIDTDGGNYPLVPGTVTITDNVSFWFSNPDECIIGSNQLKEYYCASGNSQTPNSTTAPCPTGYQCVGGGLTNPAYCAPLYVEGTVQLFMDDVAMTAEDLYVLEVIQDGSSDTWMNVNSDGTVSFRFYPCESEACTDVRLAVSIFWKDPVPAGTKVTYVFTDLKGANNLPLLDTAFITTFDPTAKEYGFIGDPATKLDLRTQTIELNTPYNFYTSFDHEGWSGPGLWLIEGVTWPTAEKANILTAGDCGGSGNSYMLSTQSDLDTIYPRKIIVIGKLGISWGVGTTGNECGNYWDGATYVTSSEYTDTVYEKSLIVVGGSSHGPFSVFTTSQVGAGGQYSTFQKYKEHASDDAECVQGTTTYYKYVLC